MDITDPSPQITLGLPRSAQTAAAGSDNLGSMDSRLVQNNFSMREQGGTPQNNLKLPEFAQIAAAASGSLGSMDSRPFQNNFSMGMNGQGSILQTNFNLPGFAQIAGAGPGNLESMDSRLFHGQIRNQALNNFSAMMRLRSSPDHKIYPAVIVRKPKIRQATRFFFAHEARVRDMLLGTPVLSPLAGQLDFDQTGQSFTGAWQFSGLLVPISTKGHSIDNSEEKPPSWWEHANPEEGV
jgi:hypothetical protein